MMTFWALRCSKRRISYVRSASGGDRLKPNRFEVDHRGREPLLEVAWPRVKGGRPRFGPFKGILIDEIVPVGLKKPSKRLRRKPRSWFPSSLSCSAAVRGWCSQGTTANCRPRCSLPRLAAWSGPRCSEAEQRGLTLSLYGRLVKEGLQPYFLDTQFRSHPKLMEWVADSIYDGRLQSSWLWVSFQEQPRWHFGGGSTVGGGLRLAQQEGAGGFRGDGALGWRIGGV